jgi:alkanesulfonate monooxygenase SsuD/methylene tetrahydromethanopterin reductase-like flavin-dependent oxidoreductase (luciferase family)
MERDIVPVTILTHSETTRSQILAGQEAAAGRDLKFGQRMAMSREIIVADTDAEAEAIAREARKRTV